MASGKSRHLSSDSDISSEDEFQENAEGRQKVNVFANDGSFMEMFKKSVNSTPDLQQATVVTQEKKNDRTSCTSKKDTVTDGQQNEQEQQKKTSLLSFVGKRRGGKVLPTGMVKKQKQEGNEGDKKRDAWSQYMDEVRKYKERSCEDEGKRRPLVK